MTTTLPQILAVPNFSEGTDAAVIVALEDAAAAHASLLDSHSDRTHNRTVLTVAGQQDGLVEAVFASARIAVDRIDMTHHTGAHPCIGAIDVAPIVYSSAAQEDAANIAARELAEKLAGLALPVFFYGNLSTSPERRERAFFRRGGIEALTARIGAGDLLPDLGPAVPHPSAGAVLVGARPPLAAFNVELEGASLAEAREIAIKLRESGGGLPGVRAIAIDLPGERVQISTNIHDPIAIPLAEVVTRTASLASTFGAKVSATELLGLVPAAALAGFPTEIPTIGGDVFARTIEAKRGAASS